MPKFTTRKARAIRVTAAEERALRKAARAEAKRRGLRRYGWTVFVREAALEKATQANSE